MPETEQPATDFVHNDPTERQEKWGEVEERKRGGVWALLTIILSSCSVSKEHTAAAAGAVTTSQGSQTPQESYPLVLVV